MTTEKTKELPPDEIHKGDVIKHPETGEWVTVRAITEGHLGSQGSKGDTRSAVYYFLHSEAAGNGILSIVDIPGENPALRTAVNPKITRRMT